MNRRLQLLFFTIVIICAGCRREESNPEKFDLIYSDLLKVQAEKTSALEAEKKKVIEAQKDLAEALPNTIDLKNAQRDLASAKTNVRKLEQQVQYISIRTKRRLVETRLSYHLAFIQGKEKDWPDQGEFEQYATNSRLQNAPRHWGARVPKLFNRKPSAADPKK